MQFHRFESLRERLLCAGVAPRHVRRFLGELRDHYEDALRAELARGADLTAAGETAWARLGSEESLVQSVIDRPELRSTAARFPALVFGLAPVLVWLATAIGIGAVLGALSTGQHADTPARPVVAVYVLWLVYVRLAPILLGMAALDSAARRRLSWRWPVAGAAVIDALAGTCTLALLPGRVYVNSALLPWLLPFSSSIGPKDVTALAEGLLRAASMLVLSLMLHGIIRRVRGFEKAARAEP